MMLGPGSIEWGSKRSALEKFGYAMGDLALCDRHSGEWVGVMNVPHLQLGISDAALTAASMVTHDRVRPAPRGRGLAGIDIFRLEKGKLVEHWDARQPVPGRLPTKTRCSDRSYCGSDQPVDAERPSAPTRRVVPNLKRASTKFGHEVTSRFPWHKTRRGCAIFVRRSVA